MSPNTFSKLLLLPTHSSLVDSRDAVDRKQVFIHGFSFLSSNQFCLPLAILLSEENRGKPDGASTSKNKPTTNGSCRQFSYVFQFATAFASFVLLVFDFNYPQAVASAQDIAKAALLEVELAK